VSLSNIIAIVGRPNVGKSTLFNRLAGQRIAVVHERAGVTRDRLTTVVERADRRFYLIDTGGISLGNEELKEKTTVSALEALEEANLVLFMIDVRTGITEEDLAVAKILRRQSSRVWLLANKVERIEDRHELHDLYSLGLGEPMSVSALHGEGIHELWERLLDTFPAEEVDPKAERRMHLAMVGRPNVGKSSITNAILGVDRMIVSDIPGTTRDSVDSMIKWHGKDVVLVDTAGLRKKARVKERLEYYSNLRSLSSIDRAEVTVLVLDATQEIAEQDQKIASYAHEAGRGIVLVVNKWDLLDKSSATLGEFVTKVREELEFIDYAPIIFVSAETKQRIHQILETAARVYEERGRRISTSKLNDFIQELISFKPPHHYKGGTGKIYYTTQLATAPPTFAVFVNNPEWFPEHYRRFMINQFRKAFSFEGSRIRLRFKPRKELK